MKLTRKQLAQVLDMLLGSLNEEDLKSITEMHLNSWILWEKGLEPERIEEETKAFFSALSIYKSIPDKELDRINKFIANILEDHP